jgi:RNA polymerase sigma factor (sigma-70 family)
MLSVQPQDAASLPACGAGRTARGEKGAARGDAFAAAGRLLELFSRTRSHPAFARAGRMMHPWLVSYVRADARDPRIDAEEAASTALANLFLSRVRFRFQGSRAFKKWMRVVARNAVRKEQRARAVRTRSLEGLPEPGDRGRDDPARRLAALEEAEILARARRLLVVLCASMLLEAVDADRAALDLHHGQGMSVQETAGRLGLKPERAAGLIRRARARLIARIVRVLCSIHSLQADAKMAP